MVLSQFKNIRRKSEKTEQRMPGTLYFKIIDFKEILNLNTFFFKQSRESRLKESRFLWLLRVSGASIFIPQTNLSLLAVNIPLHFARFFKARRHSSLHVQRTPILKITIAISF